MRSVQVQLLAMLGALDWPPRCDDCHENGVERRADGIVLDEAGRRPTVLLCRAHRAARTSQRFWFSIALSSLTERHRGAWSQRLAKKGWIRLHDLQAVRALEHAAQADAARRLNP